MQIDKKKSILHFIFSDLWPVIRDLVIGDWWLVIRQMNAAANFQFSIFNFRLVIRQMKVAVLFQFSIFTFHFSISMVGSVKHNQLIITSYTQSSLGTWTSFCETMLYACSSLVHSSVLFVESNAPLAWYLTTNLGWIRIRIIFRIRMQKQINKLSHYPFQLHRTVW